MAMSLIAVIVVAGCVLTAPGTAGGGTQQVAGPTLFGDDFHTAVVNPYPVIPVSTIASNPPGQCAWINTGLAAFSAANPNDGFHDTWAFTWAGAAVEAQVEAGIKIIDYYPWVVTLPAAYTANPNRVDGLYPSGPSIEWGGAVMNLQYTPQPGAPVINNLHWIQGLNGTVNGTPLATGLDNFADATFTTRDNTSPYYDGGLSPGTAGPITLSNPPQPTLGQGGWFLDRPRIPESEIGDPNNEVNPVADVQFQVILAGEIVTANPNGTNNHAVTLYGGEWWGFRYSATDNVPEPATFVLLAFGGMGLLLFQRLKGRKSAT